MQTDTDPDGVSRAAPTNHDHPVANRELLDDERLATIVSTLGDLPVLPDITLRALRLAEDPEWDLKELAGTIGRDQGLAAEFLRLANSAFFGGTGTISTLDRAICRVGNTRVQSILLATVLEGFHATTQSNFTGTMLWEHALVTATVSRHLATVYRRCAPEEAFMAGLLHDIGRPVMDRTFPAQYAAVVDLVTQGRAPSLLNAERSVFQFDHTEVGFVVATAWAFPRAIAETILHHHAPAEAVDNRGLCATVSLANSLCLRAQLGPDLPPPDPDLAMLPSVEILVLNRAELDVLSEELPHLMAQARSVSL